MDDSLEGKLLRLREMLASFPSALVAYSGGVDSTFLAQQAHTVLGERMKAVIVASPLLPPRELERAKTVAGSLGFPLEVVEADELSLPGFEHNPPDRCYICKRFRLGLLREMAREQGWDAVLEGSNLDDAGTHRPGRLASAELGASSPLEDAGLSKDDIRALAREAGLPNWDAPSRPCLATRFPYGMTLEPELISRLDAAEEVLEGLGLRQLRVRLDAPDAARIEVGADELRLLDDKDKRESLVKKLRGLGFRRIMLDLEGYRSGSMDESSHARNYRTLYDADANA
ncbi:MAG: ATP-dependent sacrificial sulfur transferase LarE [Actinobacteria bacterium]|nr:ATP-dependent sacrificial sulfur transferase LarE [Actinomycetota bacterium]